MKNYLLYIPIAIVMLLSVCFVSIGCSGTTAGNLSYNYDIENSIASQYTGYTNSPSYTATLNPDVTLRTPTYQQMKDFLAQDLTSDKPYVSGSFECRHFTTEVDNNAKAAGWQCGFVLICYAQGQHAVVAFNTSDRGIIFIEPQTDDIINVAVGGTYQDQAIIEILIAW
jgi:hypothetical protein